MGGALDPGRTGMEERGELARVEVAPRPLLGVVIDRQQRVALGAGEARALGVAYLYVNPLALDGQLDTKSPPTVR